MTTSKTSVISIADLTTAYSVTGDGPPLLLIHGSGADHHMFDGIAPLLSKDFTVIAYDQRDCGETEGPPVPATLSQLAQDAKSLIEALGFKRAHVFGSSFGGRVAQALAVLHPEVVDSLVLGSTWPLPASIVALNPEVIQRMVALRAGLPESAAEFATLFFTPIFLEEEPAFRGYFSQVSPPSDQSARRAEAVNSSIDVDIAAIKARTLLLAGDQDRIVPAQITLGMAVKIRGCRQVVLPGVGHATAIQAPIQVARAIAPFLLEQLGT
jgi:pimeloyl-ACP methyl ester carboxylesterase